MEKRAIPWWQSNIMIGLVVSLVCKMLVLSGLVGEVTGEQQEGIANFLVLLASGVADLVAVYGRTTQTHAPVVALTKARAEKVQEQIMAVEPSISGRSVSPGDVNEELEQGYDPVSGASGVYSGVIGQADALEQENAPWMR